MGRAMTEARLQGMALAGILERGVYVLRRYALWELAFLVIMLANTLSVVFIPAGVRANGGQVNVAREAASLLIGGAMVAYLGGVFEATIETVSWERWEGTVEHTFMAPLSRTVHLSAIGLWAVVFGVVRTAVLVGVVGQSLDLSYPRANFGAALTLLLVASISIVGIGMGLAVLPLISPERGVQLGLIAQGLLLVVSGVFYPVSVLPEWMQWLATVSPATYALDGLRAALLDGAGLGDLWHDVWPMLAIGAVSVPLGLGVFAVAERHAKRTGRLKRGG